jgi:hypothetical protein
MSDQTLLLLAKDVRAKTLRLLEGVSDAQARFAPAGLQNTLLWHAGHSVITNEHLGVSPATGQPPQYPQGWFEKFSWKSQPATVQDWPKVAEVAAQLQQQLGRLLTAIEGLTEPQLSKVIDPAKGRTLRWSILHGLHDEANHQGEMWLLKKLWDKRPS